MPYPRSEFASINNELRGSWIVACADLPFETGPASRRRPWLATRFGFVGSSEGFDLLRFEAPSLALTPHTAPAILAAGLIDALVVEGALDDMGGEWGLSFLDWPGAGEPARALMRQAAEAGIPRIALLRGGRGRAALFAALASEADHVAVTEPGAQAALAERGIAAELTGLAMQPALYNAFAPYAGSTPPETGLLSLDLDRAVDNSAIAETLTGLIPFGLRVCAPDLMVRQHRIARLGALQPHCLGTVTPGQLRHLLQTGDIVVQIARPDRDPGADVQHALHAAACRCGVAILGEIPADDPRRGFAHVFEREADLRAFLSRFVMDPVWAEKRMQEGWRRVHRDHAAAGLAARLAKLAGEAVGPPRRPVATVVTPTFRPELLPRVLANFRAQTWPDKELIVVANTDRPEEWQSDLLDTEAGEQIVFLSRRFGPGTALNLGAARSTGDYVMRMDDDDDYGAHYVEDMMLGAEALWPDIMGKSHSYYNYVDDGRLVWVADQHRRPSCYTSDALSTPRGGHLAGFTHTVRRALFARIEFPHSVHGAADSGFLIAAKQIGDLLCARADGLNAVVQRRADASSHTWQTARLADDPRNVDLAMDLESFLA